MNGRMAPKGITTHSKAAPGDDRRPDGREHARNAPRRFWACVVIGLLLGIAGRAYAGEPPSFKRAARVTLQQRHVEERDAMAFSVNTWLGNTGAFTTATNWSHGHAPAGDDIGVLDGTSVTSITSGLDHSGTEFRQFLVKPEYTGQIGSQGNPLLLNLGDGGLNGFLVYRGSGQGFINLLDGAFGNVVVDTPNVFNGARYNLVLGGAGAGNVSQCAIKRGNVLYSGDLSTSGVMYVSGDAARLVVNVTPQTAVANVICNAGQFINKRSMGANAFLMVSDSARVTQIGALLATNHVVVTGGVFKYLPTSAPGTSPLLSVMGGLYDMSDERFDNVWGTTVIGPGAFIKGGVVRGANIFPASVNLQDEYPGPQE